MPRKRWLRFAVLLAVAVTFIVAGIGKLVQIHNGHEIGNDVLSRIVRGREWIVGALAVAECLIGITLVVFAKRNAPVFMATAASGVFCGTLAATWFLPGTDCGCLGVFGADAGSTLTPVWLGISTGRAGLLLVACLFLLLSSSPSPSEATEKMDRSAGG